MFVTMNYTSLDDFVNDIKINSKEPLSYFS